MYWPVIAGQTVFPVQTAIRYKIPLIIWGAHQGIEQVGMYSHLNEVEMTRRYRKNHDLFGFEADDLLSQFDTLKEADIWQYRYPDDADINALGIRGIYLGNYIRWDPKAQHEIMVRSGFRAASCQRTFDKYDFADCFNYMNIHDILKIYRHGYSKVTDHACREIRFKRLTRETAIQLVSYYELQEVKYLDLFCEWLGIDEWSLQFILNQFRSPKYWKQNSPSDWAYDGLSKRLISEYSLINNNLININSLNYDINEANFGNKYITLGKGI